MLGSLPANPLPSARPTGRRAADTSGLKCSCASGVAIPRTQPASPSTPGRRRAPRLGPPPSGRMSALGARCQQRSGRGESATRRASLLDASVQLPGASRQVPRVFGRERQLRRVNDDAAHDRQTLMVGGLTARSIWSMTLVAGDEHAHQANRFSRIVVDTSHGSLCGRAYCAGTSGAGR